MSTCIFCQIIAGKLPASKVYEDDHVVAFLDLYPINQGHVLVVPKAHFGELHELDEETGARLFRVAMRIDRAIRQTNLRCEGTNLLQNNGAAAMQEIFHVHLHIIPRYRGDHLRFSFLHQRPSRAELDQVASDLRQHLEV